MKTVIAAPLTLAVLILTGCQSTSRQEATTESLSVADIRGIAESVIRAIEVGMDGQKQSLSAQARIPLQVYGYDGPLPADVLGAPVVCFTDLPSFNVATHQLEKALVLNLTEVSSVEVAFDAQVTWGSGSMNYTGCSRRTSDGWTAGCCLTSICQ
jgi:hypothetical protein